MIEAIPGIEAEVKKDFGVALNFDKAKDLLEENDGAGNTFKATAKPVLIGTAVVGAATQRSLNMSAHLVADPARAEVLVEMFPEGDGEVLVVQGNLADDAVELGIGAKGWNVTRVVAYRTVQLQPEPSKRERAVSADALLLASSSAASAWCDAFGTTAPEVVVAIGPSTAKTAHALGLHVTAVAHEQSLSALIETTSDVFGAR
jgi:uroporphyrinogen-III synthase